MLNVSTTNEQTGGESLNTSLPKTLTSAPFVIRFPARICSSVDFPAKVYLHDYERNEAVKE